MYDTIIIGAGMSGLAAGIRLAYYDRRVLILERHETIGGLNSFYRLDGRNYDVGLHAMTNFTPRGTRKGPLARLLKQLRFAWDEFSLVPQIGSKVAFPGVELNFNNDFALLACEIENKFPAQKDNFQKLVAQIGDYDELDLSMAHISARKVVSETITDPLLVEMLLCPLLFYGSAREHDLDFAQFCILFRSIYVEGLARPHNGVRLILRNLVKKFKHLGGELRLRAGVNSIKVRDDEAQEIQLDNGTTLAARNILSSAGWVETMRLCGDIPPADQRNVGQLSFVEAVSVLNVQPRELGHNSTIVFFSDDQKFHWHKPEGLVDVRSGVICSPNNFQYEKELEEGMMRITALANYSRWSGLNPEQYKQAKVEMYEKILASAVRFVPDFRPHIVANDVFTPTTIRRFTGHENGAVYGAPVKHYDGRTHLKNVFICGTDQGFVGIIGSIISGISIANQYLLKAE